MTRIDKRIPWDDITDALLEKYSAPAPRYTSYPTAPEWSGDFGTNDYAEVLEEAAAEKDAPISLYVHVPFCKERCLYCGCASWLPTSDDVYDVYLDAVEKEVSAVASRLSKKRVRGLHWGGGTPTTLSLERITRLHKILTDRFDFGGIEEAAVEVAPAVTSVEQVERMAELGFNRMSLGVQDFTKEVQEAVNRIQSVEATRALIERARQTGFKGVNVDLMYGLPRQRLDTWSETLETVIGLGPDRLAVFGYAHVPWMRPHQKQMNEADLPDTDLRFDLFRTAHDTLVDAGYVYIGMDHFARPEDELAVALEEGRLWRNFQGYTTDGSSGLVGFGVTAIGDLFGAFAQNQSTLESYQAAVNETGLATFRGMRTSAEDRLRRRIVTDLMCNLRLDIPAIESEFEIDFFETFKTEKPNLEALAEDGLVTLDARRIVVRPLGRAFVRHVGVVFDTYTRDRKGGTNAPKFSKTM